MLASVMMGQFTDEAVFLASDQLAKNIKLANVYHHCTAT
jgi:hypothetical protein